jgi:acetone carboxylase gamma subunit
VAERSYTKEILKDLIEGKLPWERTKQIISGYKEEDRFEKYVDILQEKVKWKEKILLPLTDELYIVQKGAERVIKCSCGYEYGEYRENWKLKALIHVMESKEELKEVYPYPGSPDPEYCEIREYYCPGCGTQLQVETVPYGYPVVFDFLPDLDSFYREWLGRPLPQEKEFKDLSYEYIKKNWSGGGS